MTNMSAKHMQSAINRRERFAAIYRGFIVKSPMNTLGGEFQAALDRHLDMEQGAFKGEPTKEMVAAVVNGAVNMEVDNLNEPYMNVSEFTKKELLCGV